MRGGATCNSAVARRTRSTIARVCREAAADHDEEPDRAEEVTATPNSWRSGSIASQGPVVVSPGNVNSAGSQTSNAQATGAVGASQGRASNKRKLMSIVWEGNFEKKFIDGEWKAECMYCHKLLTAKGTSGTSHLKSHMSSCGARHAPIGPKQQKLRVTKVDDGKANLENTIFDQDVARKELALMICLHEYPLSMVDHSGFWKFCSTLQPMFRMVSRNNIRTDILDMYAAEKDKMVKYFANFKNRVVITTDMWTAKYQKRGYMVVTAHFIDEFWQLKSFILRFVYVPSPHNAAVICEALRESLVEWHLERKISTVTLDNCTPNDKAMEHLPDKLDSDSLILEGKYLHMRCATHILNLIVKDGMDVMEEGIERVRDSVGFWSATPKRHEKFEKMARTLNIEYKKRLALDCKTRRNSTYTMLTIALEYIEVFEKLKAREKLFSYCPTKDDWKVAKELCDRPKNFFDVTEAFSGSKYVTANLFFPKICGIQLAIQKWATSDNEVVQKMSEEMKLKFDKYWKDVHGLMSVATVLDPRYKLHMLQALFGSLYGMEYATVKVAEIRNLMADLLEQYREDDEATATSEVVSMAAAQVAGIDDVMNIFDKYMSSQPTICASQVRTELDLYLEEPTTDKDMDIINWWKFGGAKYPTLQRIAHDILSIPVTTVASESAFSTSGRLLSPHRSRLAPNMAEALMCMQAWSRADMIGDSNSTLFAAFQSVLDDEEETMDGSDSIITEA